MKNKKPNKLIEDDWCDDCGVCAFMRESERLGRTPTVQEMSKVFAEQNQSNSVTMLKDSD